MVEKTDLEKNMMSGWSTGVVGLRWVGLGYDDVVLSMKNAGMQ